MPSHEAGHEAWSHTRSYKFARQLQTKINKTASFQNSYSESCGIDINQEAGESFKDGGGGRQQKKPKQTSANKSAEVQEIWEREWAKYK